MNKLILSVFIVAAGLFSGCITPWTVSNGGALPNQSRYGMKMNIPKNWYKRRIHDISLLTRNGISLESIIVYRKKWSDTLSNGHTIPKTVMLHQLPELLLGEYSADGDAFNLSILANNIVPVDNMPCARSYYRYTSPNSLNMRGIMYCIPFHSHITVVCFEAEESHYYSKAIDDFSVMENSMMIRGKRYRPLPGISVKQRGDGKK